MRGASVFSSNIPRRYLFAAIFATVLAGFSSLPLADSVLTPDLHPNPAYSPQEVVRIQIGALAHNDRPHEDAGIEITFRFASPNNRRMTGPLARFVTMLKNPLYRHMLNHKEAEFGPAMIEQNMAQVPVILTSEQGERAGFVFTLSRQSGGEFDSCWMTDSVVRFRMRSEPRRGGRGKLSI